MMYSAVIAAQEKIIMEYSKLLHQLVDELGQYRSVEAEEKRLAELDEKGGIRNDSI